MKPFSDKRTQPCQVPISTSVTLEGLLTLPEQARALILFAHGSGSSRFSPRNQFVAQVLHEAGLATLLIDLLTPQEEEQDQITAQLRFDIPLLSERVIGATRWLAAFSDTTLLRIGYFGASTGAAAALIAAAELPHLVGAVVSRGGRPDLAGEALSRVHAPTLLLVGARDAQVIELNRQASFLLKGEKRLELIVGATHLFEEPGTLELVAQRAQQWFAHYLRTEHLSHSGKKREKEQQTTILYQDRFDAGQQLVAHLHAYAKRRDVLVLALPRGGVPVAFAVARALHAPLDVFLVRKLGVPGEEELALGAIASGNIRVLNDEVVQARHLSQQVIEQVEQQERRELARYEQRYRGDRPPPDLHDRIVILVDDGLATGASMRAAVQAVRKQQPARLVVAVPVADSSVCEALRKEVDEVVCAQTPAPLYGISAWYRDFAQVSDQEVHALLAQVE